ncbi:MAG: M20/M25/M40 family metallo-hydrolase [Anaerolineaceae bacterium]
MLISQLLFALAIFLLFLGALMMVLTMRYFRPIKDAPPAEMEEVDQDSVAEHLAAVIRCQTISSQDPKKFNARAFLEMRRTLESNFPRVHSTLKCVVINDYSLLFLWRGARQELEPVLFTGHLDVVPAEPETGQAWTHPPFSGQIASGFVWGRGALDIKSQVVTMLEAAEHLIRKGYTPQRSILLAFGHDEEVGGAAGAAEIAAYLKERNVHLEAVLDEGSFITEGLLPGVIGPAALIGTAEKGNLAVELQVEGKSGHSAAPPAETAIGILARAVRRVEENPFPARIYFYKTMFRSLSSGMTLGMQFLFANLWLFGGLLTRRLAKNPQSNAGLRTTSAATLIRGGVKANQLPASASAVINLRLLPGDTIAYACDEIRKRVRDPRVKLQVVPEFSWEASGQSSEITRSFLKLKRAACQVFDQIPVAPFLVLGATDSRHYAAMCSNVYRFTPFVVRPEDVARIHGVDERIKVEALEKMVQFYALLMRAWGKE